MLTSISLNRYPTFHAINNATFTPIEFIFFSTFFYKINSSHTIKKFIVFTAVLFLIFWIFFTYFFGYKDFDSVPIGIEFVLLLLHASIYYYQQLKEPKLLFILNDPVFWFVSTIFFFTAGTFFIFIFAQIGIKNKEFVNQYFLINISLLLIRNLLLAYSMTKKEEKIQLPVARF